MIFKKFIIIIINYIKRVVNLSNRTTFFRLKTKPIVITNLTEKKRPLIFKIIFIFIVIIFILVFLEHNTVALIKLFYPDILIDYLNTNISQGYGFTFFWSFLPFANYHFFFNGSPRGVYSVFKLKVQQRMILLLKYLGSMRPLYKSKYLEKNFFSSFFSKISIIDKSKLYVIHKIGSFKMKDFILNTNKKLDVYENTDLISFDDNVYKKIPYHYFWKYRRYVDKFVTPYRINETSDDKTSLSFLNLYLDNIANTQGFTNRKIRRLLYKRHKNKLFFNKNYFYFRGKVKGDQKAHIYSSSGLNYITSDLVRLFIGLNEKKLGKIYLPLYGIREPMQVNYKRFQRQGKIRFRYFLIDEKYERLNKLLNSRIGYFFLLPYYNLIKWNWYGIEASLYQYFYKIDFANIPEMYDATFRPYRYLLFDNFDYQEPKKPFFVFLNLLSDYEYLYKSNAFYKLYFLYIADLNSNIHLIFDGYKDLDLKSGRGKPNYISDMYRTGNWHNNQQNDFFIDYFDGEYFFVKDAFKFEQDKPISLFRHKKHMLTIYDYVYGNVTRKGPSRFFEEIYGSGQYPYFAECGSRSVYDFAFYKNFYYRYKYTYKDIYYLKHLNFIHDFYLIYVDLQGYRLKFGFFFFFYYSFKYIFDRFLNFCLLVLFSFIGFFFNYVFPLVFFLDSNKFKGSFIVDVIIDRIYMLQELIIVFFSDTIYLYNHTHDIIFIIWNAFVYTFNHNAIYFFFLHVLLFSLSILVFSYLHSFFEDKFPDEWTDDYFGYVFLVLVSFFIIIPLVWSIGAGPHPLGS